jgi:hypothetical protein
MLKLIRAVIEKVEGRIYTAKGFVGQTLKGELWQHYGFASRPRKDAKGVVLALKNGSFLIATSDPSRTVEIDDGEVCVHASPNVKILLRTDDTIEITAEKVKVKSEKIELGNGTLEKMIKGETFMGLYNEHYHTSGDPGKPTSTIITTPNPDLLMTEVEHLSQEVKNA